MLLRERILIGLLDESRGNLALSEAQAVVVRVEAGFSLGPSLRFITWSDLRRAGPGGVPISGTCATSYIPSESAAALQRAAAAVNTLELELADAGSSF